MCDLHITLLCFDTIASFASFWSLGLLWRHGEPIFITGTVGQNDGAGFVVSEAGFVNSEADEGDGSR